MMKKIPLFLVLIILPFVMIIQSCENTDGEMSREEAASVRDDALSAELFEDIFNETDQILEDRFSGLKGDLKDTCKTVTMEKIDTLNRRITIDYGKGNCEDFHGRVKKGKIIVTTSGRYRKEGFTRTIRFEDFYVNEFKIEGTKTVINEGKNNNGNVVYSISLKNGKISTPGGLLITRKFDKTREWIKGYDTPLYQWDNEYLVTGTASGTNRNGVNYTRTINDPLHTSATCRYILSGTAEIETGDKPSILIDYGDGDCDDRATATVEGTTKEIRLKR
jgi:hypothetical protein